MTTETIEVPLLDTLEDQEKKLGDAARTIYLAAGEMKKAARAKLAEWDQFFGDRGINPNRQIERLTAAVAAAPAAVAGAAEEVAAVPALASHVAVPAATAPATGKETEFVMKHAQSQGQGGFTMDEIIKEAVKQKVLTADGKEARQPFYKAILGYKNTGVLVEAEFQRDGKTVYVLPKKA